MADSILRLRVQSDEYDNKLKRAAEGLNRYVEGCRKVGGTLEVVEKDTLDFVRAMGQMETTSKTATGKLAEMKKTFTEWSVVYKQMTDAEKASPIGKALSESLDQLKGRITDAKKELADINKELEQTDTDGKNLGGVLDQLAGKFGLSTKALTTWGAALAAGKLAIDTVKGAIESTEATHDTFAKTMAVADNVTNQFLRTLATADFSTFISGLQGIIDKTTQAYEAMDEFESYAARFQPWQSAKEGEIQTKLQQARAAKAQGDKQKAEQLTKEAKTLIDQLAASTKAYGEKQTAGGYATIRSLMGGVDITNGQIAWYADPRNWEKAQQKAQKYKETIDEIDRLSSKPITKLSYDTSSNKSNENRIAELKAQLAADPSLKRAYTMLNLRDSGDSKQAQAFKQALGNIYGNTLAESRIESLKARADRMEGTVLGLGSGTGKTSKTYDEGIKLGKGMEGLTGATIVTYESMEDLQRQLNAYKTALNRATNAIDEQAARQGIAATEWKMSDVGRSAAKLGWSQEDMASVAEEMQNTLYSKMEPVKIDFAVNTDSMEDVVEEVTNNTKEMANAWNDAGTAIKSVGSLLSQIEDPAAKVAGIIAEAVASIALTFAQSLKGTVTPWDWIAGAASGTATMISTIAAIKSATSGYANGGIVQGTSRTGDNNLIRANAGELILTEGQQGTIAKTLIKAKETNNIEIGALTDIVTEINSMVGEINLTLNTKILEALNKVQDYTEVTSTWAIIGALMPFAHGGIVHAANGFIGGNRYSTDDIPVMVSSGELILNRAQQGALAADLQRNDQHGATSQPYVNGEQIYLGLNNYLKRSGRGEILTSRG